MAAGLVEATLPRQRRAQPPLDLALLAGALGRTLDAVALRERFAVVGLGLRQVAAVLVVIAQQPVAYGEAIVVLEAARQAERGARSSMPSSARPCRLCNQPK